MIEKLKLQNQKYAFKKFACRSAFIRTDFYVQIYTLI